MLKKSLFFLAVCGLVVLSASVVFAEESSVLLGPPVEANPSPVAAPVGQVPDAAQMQWLWGEVVTIDTANNQLNVKYLDYETDTEKEILIATDSATVYENIQSFNEIKPGDNLSIDYLIADGKNIAKNISCTKPESLSNAQEGSMPTEQPAAGLNQGEAPVTEEAKTLPGY